MKPTINEFTNEVLDQNSLNPVNYILNQYFENSTIPQLLIDSNLFLKNFTPVAAKLFSLNNKDLNRSICGIKEKFQQRAFSENIRGVFRTERVFKKEIKIYDQSKYLICIQPWFSEKKELVSGVIITYTEVGIPFCLIKELEDLRIENIELKELLLREIRKSK